MVLAPAFLVVPWLLIEARNLRLEASIDLLSPSDPLAAADRRRGQDFGGDFRILVALFNSDHEGGVLTRHSLELLGDVHRALDALPGVREVASLNNAPALVASPGTPAGAPILTSAQSTDPRFVAQRLRASELQEAILLSRRKSLTPLLVEIEEEVPEAELARRITALAAELEARHPGAGEVLVVGPAIVETGLAEHIFNDLRRLIPFAVGLISLGLVVVFRRAVLVLVAVIHALVLLAVVLGGMAACGLSVNLVSVLAPVILIPVGVADLLHLFVRLEAGGHGGGRTETPACLLNAAFAYLERPMLGTSATTAIGFLGFLIPPVAAIRQFGVTMSAGAVAALLITFTLDAALLALVWRPRPATSAVGPRRASRLERWLIGQKAPGELRYRSRTALMVSALLAGAGLVSLSEVHIEDSWIRNFDPQSRLARDTQRFEGEFLGTNVLAVIVEADPAVAGARGRVLDLVNRLTTSLTLAPGIRGVLSATLLARSLDPEQGRPWEEWPTPTLGAMEEAYATWERRGMVLPRMRMLAEPGLNRFQVLVFVLNQPYRDLVRRLTMIAQQAEEMAGPGVRVRVGGNLAVNIRMVRLAIVGQAHSLLALLAAITVLIVGFTRSPAAGVLIVLPMGLAILLTYFFLVRLHIPYGIAVSMFPTLVVGLSVDFAIHLRAALARNRLASRTRWSRDVAVVIRGILLNGALWAGGFGVLIVSHLPPNRYLGLLCCLVVSLSTALTLLLLPTSAMLVASPPQGAAHGGCTAGMATGIPKP